MSQPDARELSKLRWKIRGPTRVTQADGSVRYEIRVIELPGFLVSGDAESDVLSRFHLALRAHLERCIRDGTLPALPPGPPYVMGVEVSGAAFIPD